MMLAKCLLHLGNSEILIVAASFINEDPTGEASPGLFFELQMIRKCAQEQTLALLRWRFVWGSMTESDLNQLFSADLVVRLRARRLVGG